VTRYQSTLEHLATHGYFAIATESQGGLFPDHDAFANDLRFSLDFLEAENVRSGSRFRGALAVGRYGASGHSMGGGASILATARDARIRAVANLAAAETDPSAIAAMRQIQVPIRLVAGSADTITPPSRHQQPMYDAGGPPRQIPILQGGWHCGFQDVSSFGCDSGPMSRPTQLAYTRRLLTGFFNLHLKGDQLAWSGVWGPALASDNQIRTQSDPGFALTPGDQVVGAPAGSIAKFSLVLRNTGRAPTEYDVLTEGLRWRVIRPVVTKTLAVGESTTVTLSANVPPGTAPGDYPLVVSARTRLDKATRAWARVVFRVP
jgi:dienelactone hydrolase